MRGAGAIAIAVALDPSCALAGFRSPQSLVQNLFAYYGDGSPEYSQGLPRDEATARNFFEPSLARAWLDPSPRPFDFLVQATAWKLGPVAISGTIKQFDRSYVHVVFVNHARPVELDIVIVKDDSGWVIADVANAYDSLTSFLDRLKPKNGRTY
jgi:hypothetical protein